VKANELSSLLRQAVSILEMYEGKDLRYVLDDLRKLKQGEGIEKEHKITRADTNEHDHVKIEQLALRADRADLRDVEKTLNSDELFNELANIRLFARLIGVDLGKRQSKSAAIQTIVSYLDRTRMHRVISSRNVDASDLSIPRPTETEAPDLEVAPRKGDGKPSS
jgi:hypothetical protein